MRERTPSSVLLLIVVIAVAWAMKVAVDAQSGREPEGTLEHLESLRTADGDRAGGPARTQPQTPAAQRLQPERRDR